MGEVNSLRAGHAYTARFTLSFPLIRLKGKTSMYCVFLDESGTNINNPIVVVAGVMIDGNTQWKPIEAALSDLRDKYVAKDLLPHFKGFHATDMFEGRKKIFSQTIRPLDESRDILRQIIELPSRFRLPVAFGYIRKTDDPKKLTESSERRRSSAQHHALAASFCAIMADDYLKKRRPNDLAWAVAEDNPDTKKAVCEIYSLLNCANGPAGFEMFGNRGVAYSMSWGPDDVPLSKIISGFHYASKGDEPLLQLADACAFAVRRWLQEADQGEELFNYLTVGRTCEIVGLDNQDVGNGLIAFG